MNEKQEAALRQAVDAWFRPGGINYVDFKPYMDALREALAEQPAYRAVKTFHEGKPVYVAEQPAQQTIHCKHRRENNGVCPHHNLQCGWPKCNEPEQPANVAAVNTSSEHVDKTAKNVHKQPAQPSKPWVGLTDKEKKEIYRLSVYVEGAISLTEAKLREKNA